MCIKSKQLTVIVRVRVSLLLLRSSLLFRGLLRGFLPKPSLGVHYKLVCIIVPVRAFRAASTGHCNTVQQQVAQAWCTVSTRWQQLSNTL